MPATVFLLLTPVLFAVFLRFPVIHDTDSYYHLAVARAYWSQGWIDTLPWARFSILHEGFGDKELLFHTLLAPFAGLADPAWGGRLALALLNGALAGVLAWLGIRATGRPWGAVLPLLLLAVSAEWAWRLVRLRPELLSLLLLLLALAGAASRRYRWLGVLAFLYTWSYTAFHAFIGLFGLLFLLWVWSRRRAEWGLVLYPVLGAGAALVLHPHFPHNLTVWWVQSVEFFAWKGVLDVGTEIRPETADEMLLNSLGLWTGLVCLGRATRSIDGAEERERWRAAADAFGLAALAFGGLYLLMRRFALYAVPLLVLALLFAIRVRGLELGGSIRLPGRGRAPLVAGLALCVAATVPAWSSLAGALLAPGSRHLESGWSELGRAVPRGAKVAATWGSTHVYMLYAPQGRYLNVLDPVFMALPHPELHRLQRDLFAGREPDIPLAVRGLDSELLAYATRVETPRLGRRLAADPRVRWLYRGNDVLAAFEPPGGDPFVLDWEVLVDEGSSRPYPRPEDPGLRALEGYVDARRVSRGTGCVVFRHRREMTDGARLDLELAPYGPTTLWVDGEPRVRILQDLGAVLGEGVHLQVSWAPGVHSLTVRTCPSRAHPRYAGFFLVERGRSALSASSGEPSTRSP